MSNTQNSELVVNPVPLGLICMSVGSAALIPMCFGLGLSSAGLETAAIFALLFGGGGQFLAGLMCFSTKNTLGGTLFTTFTFLWIINWWSLHSLASGLVPDHTVVLATEIALLVILTALTYAFGFINRMFFVFLLDIDLIFLVRILKTITGNTALMPVVGILTLVMIIVSLWISFAMLMNPIVGKNIFPLGNALFKQT